MPVTVEAALSPETTDGEDFLSDVAGMLERIAGQAGLVVTAKEATASRRSWRVDGQNHEPPALLPEVGVHRGQLARGPAGRIHTYKIALTIRTPLTQTSSDSIIRTYNYPLQRVSFHRSGTQARLAEVLAGRTRDPATSAPDGRPPTRA